MWRISPALIVSQLTMIRPKAFCRKVIKPPWPSSKEMQKNLPVCSAACGESSVSATRQRAEHRALRLFLYAAECRELLQCIAFKDPVCRNAMEWLSNLALVTVDGEITAMGLQLADQLPGAIGAAIAQAAATSPDVIAVLQRDPQSELQALLDALEPI